MAKTYREVSNGFNSKSRDRLLKVMEPHIELENSSLDEGSGVVTNTLAMKLMRDISALEKSIQGASSLENKIDLLARQNVKLAGLDAISISVSGKLSRDLEFYFWR